MSYWKWRKNRKQHDLSIIRYGYAKSTLPKDFPITWTYSVWKGWISTLDISTLSDDVVRAFFEEDYEEITYLMRPIPESIENSNYILPEVLLEYDTKLG